MFNSYVTNYRRVNIDMNIVTITGWWYTGIPTHLKNMKVSWDDYSQYMEK